MQRQNLEERAERTLRDTDAYQVPVPIHLVAQRLNLTLEAATLGDKVSGLLVVQGDRQGVEAARGRVVGCGHDLQERRGQQVAGLQGLHARAEAAPPGGRPDGGAGRARVGTQPPGQERDHG